MRQEALLKGREFSIIPLHTFKTLWDKQDRDYSATRQKGQMTSSRSQCENMVELELEKQSIQHQQSLDSPILLCRESCERVGTDTQTDNPVVGPQQDLTS